MPDPQASSSHGAEDLSWIYAPCVENAPSEEFLNIATRVRALANLERNITMSLLFRVCYASFRLLLDTSTSYLVSRFGWSLQYYVIGTGSPIFLANNPSLLRILPALAVVTRPLWLSWFSWIFFRDLPRDPHVFRTCLDALVSLLLWLSIIMLLHWRGSPLHSDRLDHFVDSFHQYRHFYFMLMLLLMSKSGHYTVYGRIASLRGQFNAFTRVTMALQVLFFGDLLWSFGHMVGVSVKKAAKETFTLKLLMFLAITGLNSLSVRYAGAPYFTKRYWDPAIYFVFFSRCLYHGAELLCNPDHGEPRNGVEIPFRSFRYASLERSDTHHATLDTIRLLLIYPRPPSGPLKCALFQTSLSSAPRFQAISYYWGKDESKSEIIVNGQSLMVPLNAGKVLNNISSIIEPKLVWIDSVCINQLDTKEKGQQVSLMGEIYRKASMISVELLADSDEQAIKENLGFALGSTTGYWHNWSSIDNSPHRREIYQKIMASTTANVLEDLHLPYRHSGYYSGKELYDKFSPQRLSWRYDIFRQFVSNKWFERMWIVQEVALATSICIRYEGVGIPWHQLSDVLRLLSKHPALGNDLMDGLIVSQDGYVRKNSARPIAAGTFGSIIEIRRMVQTNEKRSLARLLTLCCRFKATKMRDKIFSLYGLLANVPPTLLQPDYNSSTSTRSIFLKVAHSLVLEGDTARMLAIAGTPSAENPDLMDEDRIGNMPSWAPDWSRLLAAQQLSFVHKDLDYCAGGLGPVKARISNEILILENGLTFDTIAELGSVWRYQSIQDDFWAPVEVDEDGVAVRSATSMVLNSKLAKCRYPGAPDYVLREVLWRTMVGNRTFTKNGTPAPSHLSQGFEEYMAFLDSTFIDPSEATANWQDMMLSSVAEFQRAGVKCSRGRRLYVSTKGFVGVAPPDSQLGDKIVVFAGMQTPSILRSVGVQGYIYVGESYLHGIMSGEALNMGEAGEEYRLI